MIEIVAEASFTVGLSCSFHQMLCLKGIHKQCCFVLYYFFVFVFVTKSTDYVIASTRSTFVDSPVSFHEQCLPAGAPPGSSRQEFQKEKHSSRTEATAKTLVLKKTTGIRNTGPMELRKSPPRNRQQTPRQTTNYDKTNNRYNRTRSHRSTHQISAQQKVTTKAKQANFKTTTRTAQSEEV